MTTHHLSRRRFLQAGAATAGAFAISSESVLAQQGKADPARGFIDAHVHVWTDDTERYPLGKGWTKADMQPPRFTPEDLLQHARPNGVSRIVLIQMSYYVPRDPTSVARSGDKSASQDRSPFDNSYMLDTIKKYPQVFTGVAIIDENDRPAARMDELKPQGVRGFRIQPNGRKPDQWLAGEGMHAMWRRGAETGLNLCCLIDPVFLPSVDEMCRKHPKTPVVIDHFARIGVDGEIREEDLKALCSLAKHKNVTVKVSAFYALGEKSPPYLDLLPMIRRVLDAYGPERLMWASDGPFQVVPPHTYQPSIDLLRVRCDFLTQSDRDWLLRKTAERVFFS